MNSYVDVDDARQAVLGVGAAFDGNAQHSAFGFGYDHLQQIVRFSAKRLTNQLAMCECKQCQSVKRTHRSIMFNYLRWTVIVGARLSSRLEMLQLLQPLLLLLLLFNGL